MTTRSLTIQVDPAGLRTLAAADQLVALVKSTTNPTIAVVWQAVQPVQRCVVSWDGAYQVYASTTALTAGTALQTVATGTVAGGYTYTLAGGHFDAGTPGLAPTQLGVRNQDGQITIGGIPMATLGSAQAAAVNGESVTAPLDAQAVPYLDQAITVLTELVLLFPASGVVAGTLLDRGWMDQTAGRPAPVGIVLGAPLAVDLTATTSRTVHYSDATNAFVLGAGS